MSYARRHSTNVCPGNRVRYTKHYAGVVPEAVAELGREGLKITFVTEKEADVPRPTAGPPGPSPAGPRKQVSRPRGLDPRYRFDSFVVGSLNQFAHAASLAVAEAPSKSYNPLFLYGGVGLGKTHLMHAIGQYLLNQNDQLELTYISSERFINEMINAVRYDRILEFRERYLTMDILLVDDIQFLAGKEGTQTEFLYI